jgi:hypothetical protein
MANDAYYPSQRTYTLLLSFENQSYVRYRFNRQIEFTCRRRPYGTSRRRLNDECKCI